MELVRAESRDQRTNATPAHRFLLFDLEQNGASQKELLPKNPPSRKTRAKAHQFKSGVDNAAFQADSCEHLHDHEVADLNLHCGEAHHVDNCHQMSYLHELEVPREAGFKAWAVVACAAAISAAMLGLLSCYGILLSGKTSLVLLYTPPRRFWIWLSVAAHSLYSFTRPVFDWGCQPLVRARWLAVSGASLCCVLFFMCYMNKSTTWLFVALVTSGLGASACLSASVATIRGHFSGPRSLFALSLGQVGPAVGLIFWSSVLTYPQSRDAFLLLISSIMAATILLAWAILRKPDPIRNKIVFINQINDTAEREPTSPKTTHRTWSAIIVITGAIVESETIFILLSLPELLTKDILLFNITTFCSFCGGGCIIGCLFGGWMLEHEFDSSLFCYLLAQGVEGVAGLTLAFCNQLWQAIPASVIFGLSWSLRDTLHPYISASPHEYKNLHETNIGATATTSHLLRGLMVLIIPLTSDSVFPSGIIVDPLITFAGVTLSATAIASFTSAMFMRGRNNDDT